MVFIFRVVNDSMSYSESDSTPYVMTAIFGPPFLLLVFLPLVFYQSIINCTILGFLCQEGRFANDP